MIGRTKILKDSTKTRKGFNQSGAPPGRMLAMKLVGEVVMEDKIRLNQIGIARDMVKKRWLVVLKTYGKSPVKFIEIIKIKSAVSREEKPFKWAPVVRLIWVFIISFGNLISCINIVGCNQKVEVKVNRNIKFILQKMGEGRELKIFVVAGSNEEKISVSIKT